MSKAGKKMIADLRKLNRDLKSGKPLSQQYRTTTVLKLRGQNAKGAMIGTLPAIVRIVRDGATWIQQCDSEVCLCRKDAERLAQVLSAIYSIGPQT